MTLSESNDVDNPLAKANERRASKRKSSLGSHIDWGSSFTNLAGSFTWSRKSSTGSGSGGGGGNANENSMASAAAAVTAGFNSKTSYGRKSSFGSTGSDPYGPSSRHDPNSLHRVIDSDVDSYVGTDTDSDVEGVVTTIGTTTQRKASKNAKVLCKQIVAIFAIVGTIVGVIGIGIGVAMMSRQKNAGVSSSAASPLHENSPQHQQRLLEIAERVVTACDVRDQIDPDMSDCKNLCHGKLCCVENETSESNCRDDENCAVYAGCEALVRFDNDEIGRKELEE